MNYDYSKTAAVLGMFETGLGVSRSLGRSGIKTYGFDYKEDIGFRSRYVRKKLVPNALENEHEFIHSLIDFARKFEYKIPMFITSDLYLLPISRNRKKLSEFFLFNISSEKTLLDIVDKYRQYSLAKKTGIPVPHSILVNKNEDLEGIENHIRFPVFAKAIDVLRWRKLFPGKDKGIIAQEPVELIKKCSEVLDKGINLLIQEVITGPDTNHFKYCSYFSKSGELKLEFTLQKIRQYPPGFGVGSHVKSVKNNDLTTTGSQLFNKIDYRGTGSAEFKLDKRDNKYKLIELNPRYWQQNYLAYKCGINFPLTEYLDLTNQIHSEKYHFECNVHWINRSMDRKSFQLYRVEKKLNRLQWKQSKKGKIIWSDFEWSDLWPYIRYSYFVKKLYNKTHGLRKIIAKSRMP